MTNRPRSKIIPSIEAVRQMGETFSSEVPIRTFKDFMSAEVGSLVVIRNKGEVRIRRTAAEVITALKPGILDTEVALRASYEDLTEPDFTRVILSTHVPNNTLLARALTEIIGLPDHLIVQITPFIPQGGQGFNS